MKIKGIARQWEGGGYYRLRQPLEEMAKHGHEVSCEMATSDVQAEGYDIVVGHFVGGYNGWWRRMARHSRLIYEVDDDPFEIEPTNPMYRTYSNPISVDSIAHCIQVAHLVTASTEVLAERMRKYNPNVVVLQNRIDESMLSIERPRRDKLTIGWAGGSSHLNDLKECAYGLRKTLDNYDVEAHFVGVDFRHVIGRNIRHTGWCNNTTDYYRNLDFDIGLAPLKSTVFAETKSHLKALEYAALGIPVIASDAAPYRDFVIDGVTGWLVRRDHEWATRLRELINDHAMREEMGSKAKELASHWTIQQGWREWESAYEGVL